MIIVDSLWRYLWWSDRTFKESICLSKDWRFFWWWVIVFCYKINWYYCFCFIFFWGVLFCNFVWSSYFMFVCYYILYNFGKKYGKINIVELNNNIFLIVFCIVLICNLFKLRILKVLGVWGLGVYVCWRYILLKKKNWG